MEEKDVALLLLVKADKEQMTRIVENILETVDQNWPKDANLILFTKADGEPMKRIIRGNEDELASIYKEFENFNI
jgi:predicted RNA-binding protein associated with RNAse of E/G family